MITQEMVAKYFAGSMGSKAATREQIESDMRAAIEYRPKRDPEFVAAMVEGAVKRICGIDRA